MRTSILVSLMVGLIAFFITAVAFTLIAIGTQYPWAIAGAFCFGIAGFGISMLIEMLTQRE